jgi:KDO2-lipid IV(A) lauroyltransferase
VAVPFFGQEVKFSPFPAMLVRRLNARMWIGCCIRLGKQSRFRVNFLEVKVPRTDNEKEDIRNITAAVQKQFEEWIREAPGQFMWSNKRFM